MASGYETRFPFSRFDGSHLRGGDLAATTSNASTLSSDGDASVLSLREDAGGAAVLLGTWRRLGEHLPLAAHEHESLGESA